MDDTVRSEALDNLGEGRQADGHRQLVSEAKAPADTRRRSAWLGDFTSPYTTRTIWPMADQTSWDDKDLLRAFDQYVEYRSTLGLSPETVKSDVEYGGLFLRWRTGDYMPKVCPPPIRRPVPARKRDLKQLRLELGQYASALTCGVTRNAIPTYSGTPKRFLDWLDGSPIKPARATSPRHLTGRVGAIPTRSRSGLTDEFARIRESHRLGIVRTVARMTLLPSVTRVFEKKTAKALTDLLLTLPVDELPKLTDQSGYRGWFEAALDPLAATILQFNPLEKRRSIHPGYKWGHGTKVLSLFVRNLVLCSRHFTEEEVSRIEPWLYCPIDGIVMKRLRRVGSDPGVRQINQIDQPAFWRIQDCLAVAAGTAGVPRVWFDDVWSEERN